MYAKSCILYIDRVHCKCVLDICKTIFTTTSILKAAAGDLKEFKLHVAAYKCGPVWDTPESSKVSKADIGGIEECFSRSGGVITSQIQCP